MKRILSIVFIGIGTLSASIAYSNITHEQSMTVANNGTVLGVASKKEITRVVFESGNVEYVHSIAGEMQYTADGSDLYVRAITEKPLNFFVKTSGEHTYKIILAVNDIPATQLFIKADGKVALPEDKQKPYYISYADEDISSDLKTDIAKIIDVSLRPKKHIGFNIKKSIKNLSNKGDIALKQVGEITGKHLTAQKIILTNTCSEPRFLNLKDYTEEGVLAIYLDKQFLDAGERTSLIKVREQQQ